MVSCMKTTIDIPTDILRRAKRRAAGEGCPLRALVARALRLYLDGERRDSAPFQLRRHAFTGRGLQAGVAGGDWTAVRDLIYRP